MNVPAFAPIGALEGRMRYAPTRIHTHDGGASASAAFCLLLVFGDQQQLVALVKPEGTVGDEELVVALDEHD